MLAIKNYSYRNVPSIAIKMPLAGPRCHTGNCTFAMITSHFLEVHSLPCSLYTKRAPCNPSNHNDVPAARHCCWRPRLGYRSERVSLVEKSEYNGFSYISRIYAPSTHIWASLKSKRASVHRTFYSNQIVYSFVVFFLLRALC